MLHPVAVNSLSRASFFCTHLRRCAADSKVSLRFIGWLLCPETMFLSTFEAFEFVSSNSNHLELKLEELVCKPK